MFTFFKKKSADEVVKTGGDSSISSNELVDDTHNSTLKEEITTSLSIHPNWNLPKEKEYVFRFLNNDLNPLKPNQISLSGVELGQDDNGIQVTAFLRNSLSKGIKLEKAELLLLDSDQMVIARKEFNLAELGKIPGESSRPWMFIFENKTIVKTEIPTEGWSLAFNVSSLQPHRLDLDQKWNDSLPTEEKDKLEKVVESLPELKPREFNLMGIQAKFMENGELATTILFRNGSPKSVQIQQLPLEVIDANKEVVARGSFTLEKFEVKANTSKPWTFIFPVDMVSKTNPDLSKWAVRPIQSS
jgi:accessory Sec system S-layer assembly protein